MTKRDKKHMSVTFRIYDGAMESETEMRVVIRARSWREGNDMFDLFEKALQDAGFGEVIMESSAQFGEQLMKKSNNQ